MASIIERNDRFCVVYLHYDENGKRHQRWETYKTLAEAKARKNEVEYRQELGNFDIPLCRTVSELMTEYVNLYGKTTWTLSTYSSNTATIRNYILPFLGKMKLIEVTPRVIEKYYQQLLKTPAAPRITDHKGKRIERYCTASTVRKVHNVLRSAFKQAEKWELVERNPAELATVPKSEPKKRDIWDVQTLQKALECCEDERLKLCLNLAFSCSLRLGELLGLTWDCVDISEEAMLAGNPSIRITKELQRISKKAADILEQKDILMIFPEHAANNKTILILKKPKTVSSVRKVFLPKAVAEMLQRWKMEQDSERDLLGEEYHNYNLVITNPFGTPTEASRIRDAMHQLIKDNQLPPVVFHSLRHSSITYKLKLNGGDIKAVQGDSGHSQATMVTDQYSHILDESRVANAQLIQDAFYEGKSPDEIHSHGKADNRMTEQAAAAGIDPDMLIKILGNPEMVNMIKMLSKAVEDRNSQ